MKKLILIILSTCMLAGGCASQTAQPAKTDDTGKAEETMRDDTYAAREGARVIYLAGGCFWGTEQLMHSIPGVLDAVSGYANGRDGAEPNYGTVAETGYKETVRVEYDPAKVSLDAILFTYFRSIDPTLKNRQGNDRGTQYQAGVYWPDNAAKEAVLAVAEVEKSRFPDFAVELEPLRSFFDAEDYHQDYLQKNPGGYCHIAPEEFRLAAEMVVDPALYRRPAPEKIRAALTEEQFTVTQLAGTEPPFQNEYWDNHEKGIYADVVTGEPLFSSADKFDSGTGWPSFSKGIDPNVFVTLTDTSMGTARTEVRSRAGNSHLGHVFYGEPMSPGGVRFCMNSAALRFIPYDAMEAEGYGYLKKYVK